MAYEFQYFQDTGVEDNGSKNKEKVQANPMKMNKDPGFSKSRFHDMPCIKKAHFVSIQRRDLLWMMLTRALNSVRYKSCSLPIVMKTYCQTVYEHIHR